MSGRSRRYWYSVTHYYLFHSNVIGDETSKRTDFFLLRGWLDTLQDKKQDVTAGGGGFFSMTIKHMQLLNPCPYIQMVLLNDVYCLKFFDFA